MRARLAAATPPWTTLAIAAAVVAVDQLSKAALVARLPLGAEASILPALDRFVVLHHVENTGMAFGLGQGLGAGFLAIAIVVVGCLLVWAAATPPADRLLRITLGLVAGGALGNAIDRVARGAVVDFVDVRVWPVFNVADSAISVGVVLLAWHAWRAEREAREAAPSDG